LTVRTLTINDELAGSFGGLSPNCDSSGYALAAIPLSRLPTGNVTVVIHYLVPPNCRCSYPDAKASVNLPGIFRSRASCSWAFVLADDTVKQLANDGTTDGIAIGPARTTADGFP